MKIKVIPTDSLNIFQNKDDPWVMKLISCFLRSFHNVILTNLHIEKKLYILIFLSINFGSKL